MTKRTRKSHNNAILNLRIPEPILAQLTTISDAQYKSVSTVVRDLIVQHIQQNAIFLTASQPHAPKPEKKYTGSIGGVPIAEIMARRNQPQSPSTQLSDQQFSDDWL
jgi:predicted S18 family serine protease